MDEETKRHWKMMRLLAGTEWSGRARYAAAMVFYQRGLRRYKIGVDWLALLEDCGDPDCRNSWS
ncbi:MULTISPECIES: hypothetical protein [unclassified Ensifer]|uniref:hypothetical protein n=1 Tax=unclassified Ensifer TaxID=2633371 RepID=UPI0008871FF8|nr:MULTISPECIES: hypothetical protein [unclassified Ensifer]MBD9597886.1 hypothetical protein [Ensifer sp. ENS05]SDM65095.1 hypothetical protein SAMN05216328_1124 [Ensifer sp. YR511]